MTLLQATSSHPRGRPQGRLRHVARRRRRRQQGDARQLRRHAAARRRLQQRARVHRLRGQREQEQGGVPRRQLRLGQVPLHGGAAPAPAARPGSARDPRARRGDRRERPGARRSATFAARPVPHDRRRVDGAGDLRRVRQARPRRPTRTRRCPGVYADEPLFEQAEVSRAQLGDERVLRALNDGAAGDGGGWGASGRGVGRDDVRAARARAPVGDPERGRLGGAIVARLLPGFAQRDERQRHGLRRLRHRPGGARAPRPRPRQRRADPVPRRADPLARQPDPRHRVRRARGAEAHQADRVHDRAADPDRVVRRPPARPARVRRRPAPGRRQAVVRRRAQALERPLPPHPLARPQPAARSPSGGCLRPKGEAARQQIDAAFAQTERTQPAGARRADDRGGRPRAVPRRRIRSARRSWRRSSRRRRRCSASAPRCA